MAFSYRKFRFFNNLFTNNKIFTKRDLTTSEAITKAEIVLGYSLKDLSVKNIANNSKIHEKTVFHCKHPVLLAERKLDPDFEVNYKSRALLTLLLAKVVEVPKTSPQFKFNLDLKNSGFFTKQVLLAETIELIFGGCVYHTIGISPINETNVEKKESLLRENRLAIIRGDLMFAYAIKNLVKLKNNKVTELMSKSLRDFVEGECLNIKIKEKVESGDWTHLLDLWVQMTSLKNSSLISNGCQSMVYLLTNFESTEENVCTFGTNIGFAWKLVEELETFYRTQTHNNESHTNTDFLSSLPLLLHLNSNPQLKHHWMQTNKTSFIKSLTNELQKSDAIKKTHSLLDFYSTNAINRLKEFTDSEAKTALSNLIIALNNYNNFKQI